MKTLLKILIGVMSVCILLASINGCNKQKEITVIYFSGLPEGQIIKEGLPEFTRKTGIKVNFLEIPYDGVRTKEITSIRQKQGAYDVLYVDDIWLYEYAKDNIVIPLDEFVKRDASEVDFDDFIEKARIAEASLDGRIWLIPQRADAQCLFYRTDLFNDAANKTAFAKKYGYQLKVPDTWAEFRDIAEFFAHKQGLYGTVLTLKRPHFAFEFYATWYWSFSGHQFFNEEHKPVFDTKEGVDALKFLVSLKSFAPPGVSNWQHDEAVSAFAAGQSAMLPQWFAFHPVLANPQTSKISDKFSVALIPGMLHEKELVRAPSIGGGSFGIASDARSKEEAWIFIKYFTSKTFMKEAAIKGAIVTRTSAYSDPEVLKAQPAFALHLKSLQISWFRPRLVRFAEFQDSVGLAVSRAFVGEETPEKALAIAEKDVAEFAK